MGANASRADAQDPEANGGFEVPPIPAGQHPLAARLYVFDSGNGKWTQQKIEVSVLRSKYLPYIPH